VADSLPFRVGDRVRHPVFGDGLVLEVSPRAGDVALKVSFAKDGVQRKVLARAARVEKLEMPGGTSR
jgi:hypothetical protein